MSDPYEETNFYPLFGRQLQFTPVPLNADGSLHEPLHLTWHKNNRSWWSDWEEIDQPIDRDLFCKNMRLSSVQYVLTSKWNYGIWPRQHELLAGYKDATIIYDDGYSVLWNLNP